MNYFKSLLVATLSVATFAQAAQAQVSGAGSHVITVGSDPIWSRIMDESSQRLQMKLLNYLNNPSLSDRDANREARDIVDGILGSKDLVAYVRTATFDDTAYASRSIETELRRMTESSHPASFTQPVERMKWKIELLSKKIHTRRTLLHIRNDVAIATVGFYIGATLMMVLGAGMSVAFGGMGFFDSILTDVRGMIMNQGDARDIALMSAMISGSFAALADMGRRISPYRPSYSKRSLRSIELRQCEALFTTVVN